MTRSGQSVVLEFLDRLHSGDINSVLEILTDDFVVHEPDSAPYPGDHVGRDAFVRFTQMFAKVWKLDRSEGNSYREYIDGGKGRVVQIASVPATALATGKRLDLRAAEVFTIRDEKIAAIEVYYWDTKLIFDATMGGQQ